MPDGPTLLELRDQIRARQRSAVEVVRASLERIEQAKSLNAFNSVWADRALEQARDVDAGKHGGGCAGGGGGALAGVPIAIKDNLCTSFGTTTCSSKILANFRAPYDATVVRRLESAGAIIVGKTNLDEFAMGSSTENSAFGPVRNPWDETRVAGGSSGGSAAAVAAGLVPGALGSDTGGSIRQPAALCGIVGVKPTYGRVSRYGLVAFASSLDQVGPFARNVRDAALLLSVISGHDPKDSTSAPAAAPDYLAEVDQRVENLRVGVAREFAHAEGTDPQVSDAVEAAVNQYRSMGAALVDVSLPHTAYGIAAYYIIAPSEASSNLARYDGVHFGHRTQAPIRDIVELMSKSRAEGFGDEVQRRIMIGTYALSSGYYDAYYLRALKIRALIKRDFDEAFKKCDVIVCPTSPTPAFKVGEKSGDPLQMYLSDVFTVTCNIAGICGISIPCGLTRGDKPLPIGLQLLGPNFSEAKLLRIARMYEAATDWHARVPPR